MVGPGSRHESRQRGRCYIFIYDYANTIAYIDLLATQIDSTKEKLMRAAKARIDRRRHDLEVPQWVRDEWANGDKTKIASVLQEQNFDKAIEKTPSPKLKPPHTLSLTHINRITQRSSLYSLGFIYIKGLGFRVLRTRTHPKKPLSSLRLSTLRYPKKASQVLYIYIGTLSSPTPSADTQAQAFKGSGGPEAY